MQKITTFLWYDGTAEEAANFYVSVFKNGKVLHVTPGPGGKASWVSFELFGTTYYALNGGPTYAFTPAISLFVECETQAEVDSYWDALKAGGREDRCGWVADRYGLSWQIIPSALSRLLGDPDPEKSKRVMQAMLGMGKIDIKGLETAHEGK